MSTAPKLETKTIIQFLQESPDVDVSRAWERCWSIHSGIVERVRRRFAVTKHASCEGREYYTSPDGAMEGSFSAYTGPEVDWLVHSWVGNRRASILDMNATVFLGPQLRVPHLTIIFGTIPKLFFYAEYTPRVDLRVHPEYVDRYYEPANADFLRLRGDPRFTWSVSHGTYLRGLMSPVCISKICDLNDENISVCEQYLDGFVNRWFGWLDEAEVVPEAERAAQRRYDHTIRRLGYERDPMNVLVERVFGREEFLRMLDMRMGRRQMEETAGR